MKILDKASNGLLYHRQSEGSDIVFYLEDALMYSDLPVDRRVELNEVYEFVSPSVDLTFVWDDSEAFTYFKQENGFGSEDAWISIEILKNNVVKFWGYVDPKSYIQDRTEEEFSITVVDWFKWIKDNCEDLFLSFLGSTTEASLTNVLIQNFACHIILGFESYIGDIGNNLDWDDYNKRVALGMKKTKLLFEIQKNYGGFFFVNEDKKLVLANRSYQKNTEAIDISEDIVIEVQKSKRNNDLTEFVDNEHTSVLLSAKGGWSQTSPGVWQQWEGWSFVKYNEADNYLNVLIGVNGDLSNLPEDEKYIDLRQELYEEGEDVLGLAIGASNPSGNVISVSHSPVSAVLTDIIIGKTIKLRNADTAVVSFGVIDSYEITGTNTGTITVKGFYVVQGGTIFTARIYSISFTKNFTYYLFPNRDAIDRWKDFKTVLFPQRKINCSVNRTDIGLFSKVLVGDADEYTTMRSKEYVEDEYTEVEIFTIPNVDPDL